MPDATIVPFSDAPSRSSCLLSRPMTSLGSCTSQSSCASSSPPWQRAQDSASGTNLSSHWLSQRQKVSTRERHGVESAPWPAGACAPDVAHILLARGSSPLYFPARREAALLLQRCCPAEPGKDRSGPPQGHPPTLPTMSRSRPKCDPLVRTNSWTSAGQNASAAPPARGSRLGEHLF